MDKLMAKNLLLGAVMLASAGASLALIPTENLSEKGPELQLESLVPKQFGGWVVDEQVAQLLVAPELQKVIEETYSQTLSRTYLNPQGSRIMLSMAYGGSQGEGMQTHRPEVCYPAQGFQIIKEIPPTVLQTENGAIEIKRLAAQQGARHEPITYWVVVGDQQTRFGWQMKMAQLRYTLTGVIPDGMLIRVSSIDPDDTRAYAEQEDFIKSMLGAMTPADRKRLIGA
jgi:EpsI family protein